MNKAKTNKFKCIIQSQTLSAINTRFPPYTNYITNKLNISSKYSKYVSITQIKIKSNKVGIQIIFFKINKYNKYGIKCKQQPQISQLKKE